MDNKKVFDKRVVKLEEIMDKNYIPFLGGRPKRSKIIQKEDLQNLTIELNRVITFEEFLALL